MANQCLKGSRAKKEGRERGDVTEVGSEEAEEIAGGKTGTLVMGMHTGEESSVGYCVAATQS